MSDQNKIKKIGNNWVSIDFGNEDKWETTGLIAFEHPSEIADFLRKVADRIGKYKSSKEYRSDSKWIFEDLIDKESEN